MKSLVFAMMMVVASSFATVQAGFMSAGSASFSNATGNLTSPSNTNTSFVFTTNAVTSGTGSFAGDGGTTWGTFNVPAHSSSSFSISITGDFGSFSGTTTSDSHTGGANSNVRAVLAEGLFTRTGFDATPGFLSFNATKSGASYTYGFTFNVDPPATVPEPASMAIFGLGALGFAARRYRRK